MAEQGPAGAAVRRARTLVAPAELPGPAGSRQPAAGPSTRGAGVLDLLRAPRPV